MDTDVGATLVVALHLEIYFLKELPTFTGKTFEYRATIKVAPTIASHSEIYSDIEITSDIRTTIKVAPRLPPIPKFIPVLK